MNEPNEGIELLYIRDCQAWQQTLANLYEALEKADIKAQPKLVLIDTEDQAEEYNFFASPTVHIHGIDVDPVARRVSRRGLGKDRPYFYQGKSYSVPPVELLIKALEELYNSSEV